MTLRLELTDRSPAGSVTAAGAVHNMSNSLPIAPERGALPDRGRIRESADLRREAFLERGIDALQPHDLGFLRRVLATCCYSGTSASVETGKEMHVRRELRPQAQRQVTAAGRQGEPVCGVRLPVKRVTFVLPPVRFPAALSAKAAGLPAITYEVDAAATLIRQQ